MSETLQTVGVLIAFGLIGYIKGYNDGRDKGIYQELTRESEALKNGAKRHE